MKIRLIILALVALLLLSSSAAAARPAGCLVVLDGAERDAAVAALKTLLGASLMLDDYMIDLGTIQEAQRVIAALEAAPAFGCGAVAQ